MAEFILLMHGDAPASKAEDWGQYIAMLKASGHFEGGSEIGDGVCMRKTGNAPAITSHLSGFMTIQADSLAQAKTLLAGNPAYEAGGTIEIRELPLS
jgi:hypothetical protein